MTDETPDPKRPALVSQEDLARALMLMRDAVEGMRGSAVERRNRHAALTAAAVIHENRGSSSDKVLEDADHFFSWLDNAEPPA